METQATPHTRRRDVRLEPTILESSDEKALHVQTTPPPEREGDDPRPYGPGSIVANRYLLQSPIGRGRVGEVYQALDQCISEARRRNHRVTIELVPLDVDQTRLRERLARESVGLLSISHPNISRIVDFGIDGSTSFFTTELLEGASLRFLLDNEPGESLTDNEVLAIVRGLADALQYAHVKGFVHGDFRVESVFVTHDYEVRVTDLASVVLARTAHPSVSVPGGDSESPSVSEDVFGLACVVYELLWNQHPRGKPPPFETLRTGGSEPRRLKGVPRARWRALSRALEPRREKRTASVAEFAAEFGITGTETLIETKPHKRPRRRRLLPPLLWLGAASAVFALLQPHHSTMVGVLGEWHAEIVAWLNPRLQADGSLDGLPPQGETIAAAPGSTRIDANSPRVEPVAEIPDLQLPPVEAANSPPPPERAPAQAPPAVVASLAVAEPATPDAQGPSVDAATPDQGSPATATPSSIDTMPPALAFSRDTLTVSEAQGVASISVRRLGRLDGADTFTWWTGNNTAVENDDYAAFGPLTETFAAGQEILTVYVPLVSDSLREEPESFYVFVAWSSLPTDAVERLEVTIIDDDS